MVGFLDDFRRFDSSGGHMDHSTAQRAKGFRAPWSCAGIASRMHWSPAASMRAAILISQLRFSNHQPAVPAADGPFAGRILANPP